MNKYLKYLLITIGVGGVLFATAYFIRTNATPSTVFETETLFRTSIRETTLVTGKIIPQDEVEIKPQIPGIIQMIAVEEGDLVNTGDLLARVKVVPNEQTLNSAQVELKMPNLSWSTRKKILLEISNCMKRGFFQSVISMQLN